MARNNSDRNLYDPNNVYWRNAKDINSTKKEQMELEIRRLNGNEEIRPGKYRKSPFIKIVIFGVLLVAAITFGIILFGQKPEDKGFVLSFETSGGTEIEPLSIKQGSPILLPEIPQKEGFLFAGWYLDYALSERVSSAYINQLDVEQNIIFYSKWVSSNLEVTITFDTQGGTQIAQQKILFGSSLLSYAPTKDGFYFGGWYLDDTFSESITQVPENSVTIYAFWAVSPMVIVGDVHEIYQFPSGLNDEDVSSVDGGFWIAEHETRYELWYEVRMWALSNGYIFSNPGNDGMSSFSGTIPRTDLNFPVTNISWTDTVIWLNAFSEMYNLDPVYRIPLSGDVIVKTPEQAIQAVRMSYNGYCLPTGTEWEMAARWTTETEINNHVIYLGARYWIKGSLVSGMGTENLKEVNDYAWTSSNSQSMLQPIRTKLPNALNLYDMNGNVSEWVAMGYHRGGSFLDEAQIGTWEFASVHESNYMIGFRIARRAEN